jgi:hypothetical protein
MRPVSIITLIILFVSCGANPNWTQFSGNGLPDQDVTYNDIYFVDEQTGYIGGRHLTLLGSKSEETINFQNTAVLYKTHNQGGDWKQIPLPFLGSVKKITTFGDTLILKIETENDTTILVKSNNHGKDWSNLLTLTKHAGIVDMDFVNSTKGRLITTDRQNEYLIIYQHNQFDTVQKFTGNYPSTFLKDEVISLKNVPSTADYSSYLITDIKTGSIKEIKFDKSYFIASHYKYNNNLYLAASKDNVGCILKLNNAGYEKIEFGRYSKYEPDEVFVYGDKLMAIGNRQDEVGPIGVIRTFLISTDGGKTWNKEDMPSPMCIEAPTIYKDRFFISAACPPGFFQVRQ